MQINRQIVNDEQKEKQLNRLREGYTWYGVMTIWNAEAIADRLRKMLEGKQYTFVSDNDFFGPERPPEVRTSQYLHGHKNSEVAGDGFNVDFSMLAKDHAHVMVCDTYGVWSFSSTTEDQNNHEDYHQPYVHFDADYGVERFSVVHRALGGNLLRWVVMVERPTHLAEAFRECA